MKMVALVSIPTLILLAVSVRAQTSRNAIGMEFVKVPAGEFMMGCSTGDQQCNPDENPRHRVQITKSFEIGKYEVTQAQWTKLMKTNPSSNKGDNRPVETVSKLEAQDFIAKLNEINDGHRYRLPTEAEWEYAARAGMDSPYSGPLDQVAWHAGNSEEETHPVGQKKPNAWGLYDVQGNVREWVSDLYMANYYSISPSTDPTGPVPGTQYGPGPGIGGPRGRGGRGGFAGIPPGNFPPPPPQPVLPPNATQQQQIDALRQRIEQLERQLQQLRNELAVAPPRGGPPGFGPQPGPAVFGPNGALIDPLDGLPTGLPVARGGGWDQSAPFHRVSARYSYYGPTLRVSDIGLRLVREPVAK
jgi:formylglycine-generating enzyme required for sulfatase activity